MKRILGLAFALALAATAFAQEPAASPAATPIDSTNLDALRAAVGTSVTVEGLVTDVGTTKDGGITFINIGLPKKQGFVAVIFKASYSAFPDGFDKYKSQKVRISGPIKIYKSETPEIVVASPDQIAIVPAAE